MMPTRSEKGETKIDFHPKKQDKKYHPAEGLEKYLYQSAVIFLLIVAGYARIISPLI